MRTLHSVARSALSLRHLSPGAGKVVPEPDGRRRFLLSLAAPLTRYEIFSELVGLRTPHVKAQKTAKSEHAALLPAVRSDYRGEVGSISTERHFERSLSGRPTALPARTDWDGRLPLGGGGPEHPFAAFPDQATFLVGQLGGSLLHDPGEPIEVKQEPRCQALFGSPGTRDHRRGHASSMRLRSGSEQSRTAGERNGIQEQRRRWLGGAGWGGSGACGFG